MTLTLGRGANVVVLGVLNAILLHPLHVSDSQSLDTIEHKQHGWYSQSYPNYLDDGDRNHTFPGTAASDTISAALGSGKTVKKNVGYGSMDSRASLLIG